MDRHGRRQRSFPIVSNGEVFGFITASVTERPERLAESADLAARLRGLAGQACTALNNATLLDLVRRQALHDGLTGLPNRASLSERLAASFGPNTRSSGRQESVLFIDVDDFKLVNDSLGHEGGDALLIQLAERLNAACGPTTSSPASAGTSSRSSSSRTRRARSPSRWPNGSSSAVRNPFIVDGAPLDVSVSIGVAQRHPEISDAAELLRRADFAMYMAKGGGKGRYQLFDAQMHDNMVGRSALKADLATAVTLGQLRLEYQPVADLRTGEVIGLEALVRWEHPTLGLLPPADFITLAEETGDIDAIGCWVLDTAMRQVAYWRRTMDHCADVWVSVNLSAFQLPNPRSLAAIRGDPRPARGATGSRRARGDRDGAGADVEGGIAGLTP